MIIEENENNATGFCNQDGEMNEKNTNSTDVSSNSVIAETEITHESDVERVDADGEGSSNLPDDSSMNVDEIDECNSENKDSIELIDDIQKDNSNISEKESDELLSGIKMMIEQNKIISLKQEDLDNKIIKVLKENNSFQIQVRQNMQKDLDEMKRRLNGEEFIPLLKTISELFIEWRDVLDELEEGVPKRKVAGVFDILKELLEEYDCRIGNSSVGSRRNPKYSKLKNKIPIGDKDKHEKIAACYNPWIVKEPFVLYPEFVDVYVYDSSLDNQHSSINDNDQKDELNIFDSESDNVNEEV